MKMSFRFNNTHKRNYKNDQKQKERRKTLFDTSLPNKCHLFIEKGIFIHHLNGSVTVEAALVVPIFFLQC